MYQGTGTIVKRKDAKGLRLSSVKNQTGLVIDQFGRVFKNTKKLEFVGCGYATH